MARADQLLKSAQAWRWVLPSKATMSKAGIAVIVAADCSPHSNAADGISNRFSVVTASGSYVGSDTTTAIGSVGGAVVTCMGSKIN